MSTLRHPDWHWIARQVFRRRALVRVSYQWFQAQPYLVLSDAVMGAHVRLSVAAEKLWRHIDGQQTIQAIWERMRRSEANPPTQDELVSWVVQLTQHGLLLSDHPMDPEALSARQQKRDAATIEQRLASPLAIKMSLFDPEPLTRWLWPVVGWIFSGLGAWIVGALLLAGCLTGMLYFPQLTASADELLLSQSGLLMLLICYPVMKLVHEFAHCWMAYRFGGQVREFGIMWLILFPVPYVEASDANAFVDKRARMLVGAAGILAEALMAACAMLLWPWMEPGLARSFLYQVILIGTVSTLLFNGNPLLKFDAYFVLADYLELPNLAKRSGDYLRETLFALACGVRRTFEVTRREALILAVYGPLSLGYRVVLTLTIAWLAMEWFYVVGVLLALWAVTTGIFWPLVKSVWTGLNSAQQQHQLRGALLGLAIVLGLSSLGATLIPLPFHAQGSGRVIAAEDAAIVADGSGTLVRVLVDNGTEVSPGTPLLMLEDRDLVARREALAVSLTFLNESLGRGGLSANERAQLLQQQAVLSATERDLAARFEALTVRAPRAGFVQWAGGRAPHLGAYVNRGQVLGTLVSDQAIRLVMAMPPGFAGIGRSEQSVDVRLPDGLAFTLPITQMRVVDVGGQIPRELTVSAGGPVAEQPDQPGTALAPVWLLTARSERNLTEYLGMGFDARMRFPDRPLAEQLWFSVQQLFVRALRV